MSDKHKCFRGKSEKAHHTVLLKQNPIRSNDLLSPNSLPWHYTYRNELPPVRQSTNPIKSTYLPLQKNSTSIIPVGISH